MFDLCPPILKKGGFPKDTVWCIGRTTMRMRMAVLRMRIRASIHRARTRTLVLGLQTIRNRSVMPQRNSGVQRWVRVPDVEPVGMSLSSSKFITNLENWKRNRGVEFGRGFSQPKKSDPEKLKAKIK